MACIFFRIVGHSLKSGMNEIINILGYNITPRACDGTLTERNLVLSEEAFCSITEPSQINGMKMTGNLPFNSSPYSSISFRLLGGAYFLPSTSIFSKKRYKLVIILCLLAQNKAHLYKRYVEMIGHRTTIFFFLL